MVFVVAVWDEWQFRGIDSVFTSRPAAYARADAIRREVGAKWDVYVEAHALDTIPTVRSW